MPAASRISPNAQIRTATKWRAQIYQKRQALLGSKTLLNVYTREHVSHYQQALTVKIAHIILSRGFAGTERSTVESCNTQSQDHEVLLILRKNQAKKSGAGIRDRLDPKVTVAEVSSRFFTRAAIQKILNQWQPDVAHAHLRRATRLLAKCNTSAARISTLHIGFNGPHFLAMDGVIAISPWQLNHIPAGFNGHIRWVRNSLEPHPKPNREKIEELRGKMGAAMGSYLIGGVGRLSRSKGWDLLIPAFQAADIPEAKLCIIGEGSQEEKLKSLAGDSKNIAFLGYKANVKDYYPAFDLFVCPSREEPMGRVVLEAMDAGVKVIASDIEGPRDMLEEFSGIMFKSDDIDSLTEALKHAYKTRNQAAPQQDLSPHYADAVNRDMVSFYQETLSRLKK